MKYRFALVALIGVLLVSCDESTGTLGISADNDQISNSTSNFHVWSKSILMDQNILANNSNCYLGKMIDPETGCIVEADFAAQFSTFEEYGFPEKKLMVDTRDTNNIIDGVPVCDSCEVRIFLDSYYGDGDNPMKLEVYQMSSDPDKIMSEDSVYYTDVDLNQFIDAGAKPIASRIITATDYEVDESDRTSSSYQAHFTVSLPSSFGQHMMDKFYESADNYKDSYHFVHNVLPGLYFRCSNGTGTMMKVSVGLLNVFFNYRDAKVDTIYSAMTRFAATPEVIQSTRFKNSDGLRDLVAHTDYTYLKCPAGIATELTLPIDEIFGGEHANDSVSKASLTLTRFNKVQIDNQLGTPSEVLLVRKCDFQKFFDSRSVSNSRTNYTTSFNSTYNTYTFNNLCRLLSYCKHEKIDAVRSRLEAMGHKNFTDEQFAAEEALWMAENPDWNKVILVPVVTSSITKTTTYGTQTEQVSVNHDMGLSSIRLVGGANNPIEMQVIYSRFSQ